MFLIGCEPTQSQIDQAMLRQQKIKNDCELVATSLDGKAQLIRENNDWICEVVRKNNPNNARVAFWIDDLTAISRFLYIKGN